MELTQEQLSEIFDILLQRQDALMDCDCIRHTTRKAESEHLRELMQALSKLIK